jgi:hypothetical protein
LQQGEWWRPTANCNHTWNCLGRKEGRIWEKRSGKVGRRTEREEKREKRGAQESRKTAAANGGDGRTDGRQLLISLVGWDFKYSDLPNRVVVAVVLEPLFFFLPLPVWVKRFSPR